MTLFDLAAKNIGRNMKSYALYLGSMIFSIVIYFTFVTLKYSDDISASQGFSTPIKSIMNLSSIVLLIFVAIFIAYSNSFFLKKRKKEVGLYSLLGVRKQKIGMLLFFENLIIGLFSLVVGVVVGFFLSKLFLTILIRLMGFEVIAQFAFSSEAVVNTFIVFFIIFLFTSLQGYFVIYRFQLIDLFRANEKGEELPKARWIAAFAGVLMLAVGYWLAAQNIATSAVWRAAGFITVPPLVIILVVAGTYLLFHSVLVYVLTKMKNNTLWAWRGLNLMSVSQLLYRIRGNAKTLTLIAVLSATTITAGGSVFSLYYTTEKDAQAYLPYTFMWEGERVDFTHEDIIYYESYESKEIRFQLTEREYYLNVITEGTYNMLAQLKKLDVIQLQNGEAIIVDQNYDDRFSTNFKDEQILVGESAVTVVEHNKASLSNTEITPLMLVVAEDVYNKVDAELHAYNMIEMENEKEQLAAGKELQALIGEDQVLSSFPLSYSKNLQALGSLLFVGTFLGLVFLVATGSIIYFKMMTEAEEDRSKYAIMHKIGVNKLEMNKAIRAQVATIFAVPLLMGVLHSAFALKAFSSLFMLDIVEPVLIWMAAYAVIYLVYYIFTAAYFRKTVQQNFKLEV